MKNFFASLCGLLLVPQAQAQKTSVIPPHTLFQVKVYSKVPAAPPGSCLFRLPMSFARSDKPDTAGLWKLKGALIERVDYVYTACSDSSPFDQERLDKKRFTILKRLLPEAFENPLTRWRFIEQSAPPDKAEAEKRLHGFMIYYRPLPSPETTKSELAYLRKMLGHDSLVMPKTPEEAYRLKFPGTDVIKTTPLGKLPGDTAESYRVLAKVHHSGGYREDTISMCAIKIRVGAPSGRMMTGMLTPDSVVSVVLRRNKEWKRMLILCDVTGSMSPYSAQLLAWYKLHAMRKRVDHFIFFNDGDATLDHLKRAGACGGIYGVSAASVDSVMDEAYIAMMRGSGGDTPENNLEALKYGIEKYEDAGDIIMIADNWATPRDMILLKEIKKPVRIIVCGAWWGGVNPAYLEIALATGGSVHTMEQDLTGLAKLREGQTLKVGKKTYRLRSGKFILESTI